MIVCVLARRVNATKKGHSRINFQIHFSKRQRGVGLRSTGPTGKLRHRFTNFHGIEKTYAMQKFNDRDNCIESSDVGPATDSGRLSHGYPKPSHSQGVNSPYLDSYLIGVRVEKAPIMS